MPYNLALCTCLVWLCCQFRKNVFPARFHHDDKDLVAARVVRHTPLPRRPPSSLPADELTAMLSSFRHYRRRPSTTPWVGSASRHRPRCWRRWASTPRASTASSAPSEGSSPPERCDTSPQVNPP